jgi:hypothetical protein
MPTRLMRGVHTRRIEPVRTYMDAHDALVARADRLKATANR